MSRVISLCGVQVSDQDLSRLGRIRQLKRGTLLMRQFDQPGPMYFVLSGVVRVLRMSPGGPPEELARLGEGAHVGEVAALLEVPRSASVEAVTTAQVLEMTPETVRDLAAQHTSFAQAVAEALRARAGRAPTLFTAESAT